MRVFAPSEIQKQRLNKIGMMVMRFSNMIKDLQNEAKALGYKRETDHPGLSPIRKELIILNNEACNILSKCYKEFDVQ